MKNPDFRRLRLLSGDWSAGTTPFLNNFSLLPFFTCAVDPEFAWSTVYAPSHHICLVMLLWWINNWEELIDSTGLGSSLLPETTTTHVEGAIANEAWSDLHNRNAGEGACQCTHTHTGDCRQQWERPEIGLLAVEELPGCKGRNKGFPYLKFY